MDIFTLQNLCGNVNTFGPLGSAHASSMSGMGFGSMTDRFGSQPFSFMSNQSFGTNIFSCGNNYLLKPDIISRMPFGQSWNLTQNGQSLGWIGLNNSSGSTFASVGGSLGASAKTGLLSILGASNF